MPDQPLDGDTIRAWLAEVAAELSDNGPQHVVLLVGGALMALHGLRESTVDVDSSSAIAPDLQSAVALVGARHAASASWLNGSAVPFKPATLDEQMCEVLFEHDRLRVLGAPLEQVFLMKLYGARTRDLDDLVVLWPVCRFESAREVAEMFHEAYPHAPRDEHLVSLVDDIARRASRGPQL